MKKILCLTLCLLLSGPLCLALTPTPSPEAKSATGATLVMEAASATDDTLVMEAASAAEATGATEAKSATGATLAIEAASATDDTLVMKAASAAEATGATEAKSATGATLVMETASATDDTLVMEATSVAEPASATDDTPAAEATLAPEATLSPYEGDGEQAPAPAKGYVLVSTATQMGWLPLPEEGDVTYPLTQLLPDGTEALNVIHLTPEGVYVEDASCENHDCVNQGMVTLENRKDRILGNMIICLPNQVMLQLYTPEELLELMNAQGQ